MACEGVWVRRMSLRSNVGACAVVSTAIVRIVERLAVLSIIALGHLSSWLLASRSRVGLHSGVVLRLEARELGDGEAVMIVSLHVVRQ